MLDENQKEIEDNLTELSDKITEVKKDLGARQKHIRHIKEEIENELKALNLNKEKRNQLNLHCNEIKEELSRIEKVKIDSGWSDIRSELSKLENYQQTHQLKKAEEEKTIRKISDLNFKIKSIESEFLIPQMLNREQELEKNLSEYQKQATNHHIAVKSCYNRVKQLNREKKRQQIVVKVDQEILMQLKELRKRRREDLDTVRTVSEIVDKYKVDPHNFSIRKILENQVINTTDFYKIQKRIHQQEKQNEDVVDENEEI